MLGWKEKRVPWNPQWSAYDNNCSKLTWIILLGSGTTFQESFKWSEKQSTFNRRGSTTFGSVWDHHQSDAPAGAEAHNRHQISARPAIHIRHTRTVCDSQQMKGRGDWKKGRKLWAHHIDTLGYFISVSYQFTVQLLRPATNIIYFSHFQ